MAKTKKTKPKTAPMEAAVKTIIKSIKRKSSGQKIVIENLKFVIDDEPPKILSSTELAITGCKKWVCRVKNGRLECGWEPC